LDNSKDATNKDHTRRKQQATIEFYERTLLKRVELTEYLGHDRESQRIRENIWAAKHGNRILGDAISEYLNIVELLAAATLLEIFDIDTMKKIARGRILAIAENYREWIVYRRTLFDSPELYIEIERLAQRFQQ
jgi:hypothetical protein